jgi:hypothetical protein
MYKSFASIASVALAKSTDEQPDEPDEPPNSPTPPPTPPPNVTAMEDDGGYKLYTNIRLTDKSFLKYVDSTQFAGKALSKSIVGKVRDSILTWSFSKGVKGGKGGSAGGRKMGD